MRVRLCKSKVILLLAVLNPFFGYCERSKWGRIYATKCPTDNINFIPLLYFHILLLLKVKLGFQGEKAMELLYPAPILAIILVG